MPVVEKSAYRPAAYLLNGHLQTIVPSTLRRVPDLRYRRERLELPDGDFVNLDWALAGTTPGRRLGVISHGLEGDSNRPYVRGMARAFVRAGLDALAWNYRGCGGEPNRLPRAYHLGDTVDLAAVVQHAIEAGYEEIFLTGFSAGGNVTLKYLYRFMNSLRRKMRDKAAQLPGHFDLTGLDELRDFPQFDDRYTAPMHGFASANAYYEHAASGRYLSGIRIPTLLVNALNDPLLPPSCFPRREAAASPYLYLETPAAGGHVGFAEGRPDGEYYSERRAIAFLTGEVPG